MNEIPQHANKKKDVWQTPDWLWEGIDERISGGISLDPCAGPDTNIGDANLYIGRGQDGLNQDYFGNVFINPPFSEKADWLKHVVEQRENYDTCFVVTPDSTDVKSWWHKYIVPHADRVWFPYGRVSYYDPVEEEVKDSPSFGSAVSIFGSSPPELIKWFEEGDDTTECDGGWVVETI